MSGWPSGLRRCVQVAVSSGGVGSNPTSDKHNVFVQVKLYPVLNPYYQSTATKFSHMFRGSILLVLLQHAACVLCILNRRSEFIRQTCQICLLENKIYCCIWVSIVLKKVVVRLDKITN